MRSLLIGRWPRVCLAVVVAGFLLVVSVSRADAQALADSSPAGMSVHLDDHGRPMLPPSDDVSSVPRRHDLESAAPATTRPLPSFVPAPGGGEMVVLDERFDHHSTVRRRAALPLTVECGRGSAP